MFFLFLCRKKNIIFSSCLYCYKQSPTSSPGYLIKVERHLFANYD